MKIYRTFLSIEGSGSIDKMDTIEWSGEYWLVPHWLDSRATGKTQPERIIRLLAFHHEQMIGADIADFVLTGELPRIFVDGPSPPQTDPPTVILLPPILIDIPHR